jgi:protein ImuB
MLVRTILVWCPDWPVTAAQQAAGCPPDAPTAVLDCGRVMACSASARAHGVRRGLRVRDAQARCAEMVVLPYDSRLDARAFEPVVAAVEAITPGVQIIRPGTCAIRARGPSRYFGGEQAAVEAVLQRIADAGAGDARAGVADGPFAAEQAARTAPAVGDRIHVIPPGETRRFLAPLPVDVLDRPDLVDLLRRLGLRTLGAFAGLTPADVLARFGADGAVAHRLARGSDARPVAARRPPPELTRTVGFEPALDRADQVAFSVRSVADDFVAGLDAHGLVCTTVRIEVGTERGTRSERRWLHPRWFTAADVVDRVRWQLEGTDTVVTSPITEVRLVPEEVDQHGSHVDGLWGGAPDEHLHRALSRVQSRLGHRAVVTAVVGGGRGPGDRQTLVPWGDRPAPRWPVEPPWPGSLPSPMPATIFPVPHPAVVIGADGRSVGVDGRGVVSAEPARFCPGGHGGDQLGSDGSASGDLQPVAAWAGPWPVEERWWEESATRRLARFQIVGVDGSAWLLVVEGCRWWTEARYD